MWETDWGVHWKHIFSGVAKFVHYKSFRSKVDLIKCAKSGSVTKSVGKERERRGKERGSRTGIYNRWEASGSEK